MIEGQENAIGSLQEAATTTTRETSSPAPKEVPKRELLTDTLRTRAVGPLAVEALPSEELEALEMDCGGINGLFLQQVRRQLGVSREDISRRTKIGMAMLGALEEEDRSQYQARVYMKGYLNQICRLLKLPVPEVPERFVQQLGID